LELGGNKGGSGSKATSVDQSALFEEAEEATAKYIGHTFNRGVIKELVDLNYSDVKQYPTLEHSKIGDDQIVQIGNFLNQISGAGLITADPQLEQWIRALVHAPELPDDMVENYDNLPARQKTAPPVPGIPAVPAAPADPGTPPAKKPDAADLSDELSKTASDVLDDARKAKARLIDIVVR
jgi:hypothetical protein